MKTRNIDEDRIGDYADAMAIEYEKPPVKYNVQCWVQGHWLIAQIGTHVCYVEAEGIAAYCRSHGDKTRIVVAKE